ncbi:linalool dehydratase/isomerase domain-containing protein [Nocardia harenae]|uniref:linalool dehydratase/isomerase domain-containing protein n=1 Tax=Nocardia harenae TaxID=358707 RepID=UPI000831627B|nr:hypothetical protein [Nocardia harenae]
MNRRTRRRVARSSLALAAGAVGALATVAPPARRSELLAHPDLDAGAVYPSTIVIPERRYRNGPLTRARQRRTFAILGAVELAGLGLSALAGSRRGRATGLGLMLPGGGYAYAGKPVRGALSALTSATGLIVWIGNGNMLMTPLTWLGSALLAGGAAEKSSKVHDAARVAVPLAVAGATAWLVQRARQDLHKQQAVATETNKYLEAFSPPLRGDDRPEPFVGPELTRDELLLARTVLDVARQDADDWSNYDILEQFQPTAVRYQINQVGWALSMLQYARMPAFHGYLSAAQRNLIAKYQQRKVWSYWWLENLWGNLENNPDPVRKQNVMLTGFYGLQIATYQSATGDLRYLEPGSLRFTWDADRRYEYSLSTMCDAIEADLGESPWSMIVCEPNWLYPFCNGTAANTFRIHDRMLGTNYWDRIKHGFTKTIDEEFHRPDGTSLMFKSTRTGYGNGAVPFTSVEMRPLVPELADRGWALTRAGVWTYDENGAPTGTIFKDMPRGFDHGNAGGGKLAQYGGIMDAAREAGDEELARAAWDEAFEVTPSNRENGTLQFPGASLSAVALLARGAFTRKGGWLDLVERGLPEAWSTGPLLDHVEYDDAMVARAETDGERLDFVLYPVEGTVRTEVRVTRLRPGGGYLADIAGTTTPVTADETGTARFEVPLADRTPVALRPAADS